MAYPVPGKKYGKTYTGIQKNYDLIVYGGQCGVPLEMPVVGPILRDFYLIRYCSAGRGVVHYNDFSFSLRPGTCYVCLIGDIVTESTDPEDPLTVSWIILAGVKAALLLNSMGITSQNPVMPWEENPEFLEFLQATVRSCPDNSRASELHRIACAYELFSRLQGYLLPQQIDSPVRTTHDAYVQEALDFMEQSYSSGITVSDIAAHLGLDRSYFSKIFKQHTNRTPQEFLIELRMNKACELLRYPNATVESVANAIGLEASMLFRHFKRVHLISPSQYKKKATEASRP